jgi:penicillin-binding protein 2
VPITLAGDLTFEQIAEINLFSPQLPGVRTEPESRRVYHHGATVGHVVGHVGALERLALDDDPVLRLAGMRTGKAGVELGMEHLLRGIGGHIRQEVDARGRIVRELEEKPAEHGHDIVLSLHRRLQEKVVARMAGERQAALVAIDVETGEVPVMVSRPLIDNAVLAGADAGQELRRLQRGGGHPMVNRAIRGLYPPGSTFKMAVALAALEAGVISLKERIACDGRFVYADQTYRRWKRQGHDGCDLHKALRESCDVYFYEVARRTGIEAIARMARRLGLGQVYDCGIALQKPGIVPDPAWKQARFGRSWLGGETILAGVGQGYVATTPLQLAVMTARLASGHALEPRLVRADPRVSPPPPPLGIRPEWLEAIRRAMFAVVNEESGTGANGRIEEGTHRLAGKTGTSQVSRASSERGHSELAWHERDHALFVAFAPFARPRFAVAAVLEHAGSGGREAAPLVRDVMADLLAAEPTARSAEPPPPGEGRRG